MGRLSDESWIKFRDMFYEAELIFSKELASELDGTLGGLFWKDHWQRRANRYHELGKEEKAKENLERSFAEEDKVFEIMPTLLDKLVAQSRVADWY